MKILDDLGFDWKPENSRILKQIANTNSGSVLQKNKAQCTGKKRRWSRKEDCLLIRGHFWYGKNWVSVASLVETRTNEQCYGRAKTLLPKHSYICTPTTTSWFYTGEDGEVYGPTSNYVMHGWAMQGLLTGDVAIFSRNRTGPFGPMGMFLLIGAKHSHQQTK